MVYLLWIAAILVMLVLWLLFVPITLRADTMAERYEIVQPGTFTIALRQGQEAAMEIRIFGIPFSVGRRKSSHGDRMGKFQLPRRPLQSWIRLIRRSIQSFSIRTLVLDIDTGDGVVNAGLVPIMARYSRGPVIMRTNFQGRVYMHAEIRTHLNRLLWIMIPFLSRKH